MKRVVVAIFVMASVAMSASAALFWNIDGGGTYYAMDSSLTPLTASDDNSSVGAFLQLIHITSGTTPHAPDIGVATGVSGGDEVLAYAYMGYGDVTEFGEPTTTDGQWLNGSTYSGALIANDAYYVRVWSQPSSDYVSGHIPAGGEYADSDALIYNGANGIIDPTASENLITQAIPEPTILALGFLGLMSVRFSRKFIKK